MRENLGEIQDKEDTAGVLDDATEAPAYSGLRTHTKYNVPARHNI